MKAAKGAPSETSPLLGKDKTTPQSVNGSADVESDNYAATSTTDPEADGGNVERQISAVERERQYEGDPDLKNKIKWMFPALALGVSVHGLIMGEVLTMNVRYSSQPPTKQSSYPVTDVSGLILTL